MAEGVKREKKKRKNDLLFKIVIVLLLCVIAFSLYKVGSILYEYHQGTKQYNQVEKVANTQKDTSNIDWKALMSKYKNVKAWFIKKIPAGESVTLTFTTMVDVCHPDNYKLADEVLYEVTGSTTAPYVNTKVDPSQSIN